ncbi:MAG: type I methionyl aminopeptidase [Nitrospinota bacterium]
MILIKSPAELDRMRHASGIVGKTLKKVKEFAGEGVTTKELDRFAESIIRKEGGKPAFKGYKGFPATLCVSIDDEVVHGIPSARRLKDGELISVDVGVFFDGFFGDAATSFGIGKMSPSAQKLMEITEKALLRGIDQARAGRNLSDISHSVQTWVEENSFSVVKAFVGHGIGASLHEDPQIPNFGPPGQGPVLQPGMVFAIEPMVNIGKPDVHVLEDNWTVVTADGSLSAHFEHTVLVTDGSPEIFTTRINSS